MIHLEWIVNPVTQYVILAAGMTGCLALFLTFKSEICSLSKKSEKSGEDLAAQLREMESAMGQLQKKVAEIGERPAVSPRLGLNLTKRSQALRLDHRGESAETIAAALEAPRNEIELLLKLQQKLQSRSA